MTNKEAIEHNKNLRMYMKLSDRNQPCKFLEENYIALDMAIKALEQQPCEDWHDVPSDEMTLEEARQAVKDLREKFADHLEQKPCDMKQRVEKEYLYESLCEDLKKANAEIKRLSEPCEDTISRQAAIDALSHMMDTDGFRDGWAVSRANVDCMLRSLPSAQLEKHTDERTKTHACVCISKQQAIDAVCRWGVDNERNGKLMITMAEAKQSIVDLLDDLSPVTPQPKVGHWIENAPEYQNIDPPYICSECGNLHLRKTNYCDQCGCRMVEQQESEEA